MAQSAVRRPWYRYAPSLVGIIGATAVLVLVSHVRSLVRDGVGQADGDDFHFYWQAGQRFFADHGTIYEGAHDLRGFLYPPPSIVLFVPFALLPQAAGAWTFRAIGIVAALLSVELLARIFETNGLRVSPRDQVLLGIVAIAMGPTYTNMVYGQVNTLVLLDCLAFRWLLDRRRPALAGAVLALGVWLKIYPILCLLWVVLWERRYDVRRALVGCAVALAVIPILCLPVVPWGLYRTYLADILPAASGRTFQNVLDQSLVAAASRTAGPIADYVGWEKCDFSVVPPVWARVANTCVSLAGVVGLGLWVRTKPVRTKTVGFFVLLSVIPIVSPLGWAYVYVLAMPALLFAMTSVRGLVARAAVLGACAAYFVPATHGWKAIARLPQVLGHLVYDRYLLAAALVAGLILWSESRRTANE